MVLIINAFGDEKIIVFLSFSLKFETGKIFEKLKNLNPITS